MTEMEPRWTIQDRDVDQRWKRQFLAQVGEYDVYIGTDKYTGNSDLMLVDRSQVFLFWNHFQIDRDPVFTTEEKNTFKMMLTLIKEG